MVARMKSLRILPITLLVSACAVDAPDDAFETTAPTTSAITTLPTFRALDTVTNGTEVHPPPGTVAGDFLIAALEYDADPVVITPPPGWTLVADQISAVGTPDVFHALVYTRIATNAEPEHYVFQAPAGVYIDIQIAGYTGVSAVDQVSGEGVFTTTITAPNLFTTQPDQLLVSVFIGFTFCSWTTSAGMVKRSNFDANSLQDVIIPAVGPTGKRAASCVLGHQAAVNLLLK
jgi:hypothetical protein